MQYSRRNKVSWRVEGSLQVHGPHPLVIHFQVKEKKKFIIKKSVMVGGRNLLFIFETR